MQLSGELCKSRAEIVSTFFLQNKHFFSLRCNTVTDNRDGGCSGGEGASFYARNRLHLLVGQYKEKGFNFGSMQKRLYHNIWLSSGVCIFFYSAMCVCFLPAGQEDVFVQSCAALCTGPDALRSGNSLGRDVVWRRTGGCAAVCL